LIELHRLRDQMKALRALHEDRPAGGLTNPH
jgi:hypothetical protein